MVLALLVYLLALGCAIAHHELWGDEIHSWNIAKASTGWRDLIANSRYEGHPPLWYVVLFAISRFTHQLIYLQLVHGLIAGSVVGLLLFASPFPPVVRILLPFGYYLWFEYGTLARNYSLAILLIFGACIALLRGGRRSPRLAYYALLTLAGSTHLLALLLAGSLHLGGLPWVSRQQGWSRRAKWSHLGLGGLLLLPGAYFILPSSDSSMNAGFWTHSFQAAQQVSVIVRAPVRALLPIPAWWRHDFWNTQFLIELGEHHPLFKIVTPVVSLALVAFLMRLLSRVPASLAVFATNLGLTVGLALVFPLTTARYTGFIFIAFLVSYWLFCHAAPPRAHPGRAGGLERTILLALLVVQVAGGAFAVSRDARSPFSQSPRIGELIAEVPAGERLVTDPWTEDPVVAFTDRPLYCLGLDRPVSFLLWDGEFAAQTRRTYSDGLRRLFLREGLARVYLVSSQSEGTIFDIDPAARASFQFERVDLREGAIERWSNLYLYRVTSRIGVSVCPHDPSGSTADSSCAAHDPPPARTRSPRNAGEPNRGAPVQRGRSSGQSLARDLENRQLSRALQTFRGR